jgi:hypothetical protein
MNLYEFWKFEWISGILKRIMEMEKELTGG